MSNSNAELGSRECSHLWRIKNYSTISKNLGVKIRSVKFSAADDDLSWCLVHTVYIFSDQIFVSFSLRPECYDYLRNYESLSGNVEVYLMKSDNTHTNGTFHFRKSSFRLTSDKRNRNCNLAAFNFQEIKQFICKNELLVLCNLTYVKNNEMTSSNYSNSVAISESRLTSDLERCLIDDHFKDVTISVKGRPYRAHKTILAIRSSVFDKMLRVEMSESKNSHIDITDMEQETFEEMLYYIYTGKVDNLNESAFELLPAADKYDLKELRIMCEEVLLKKLSANNAVKILILADMHRAEKLKAGCLQFIKMNYANCEDFNDKETWKSLTSSYDHLLKDMLSAFCKM